MSSYPTDHFLFPCRYFSFHRSHRNPTFAPDSLHTVLLFTFLFLFRNHSSSQTRFLLPLISHSTPPIYLCLRCAHCCPSDHVVITVSTHIIVFDILSTLLCSKYSRHIMFAETFSYASESSPFLSIFIQSLDTLVSAIECPLPFYLSNFDINLSCLCDVMPRIP